MKPRRPKRSPAQARNPIRAHHVVRPQSQPESAAPQLVQIEKPIYGGAFLARIDGKAVFVPLTLPGEQARIRIVEEKRAYATAEAAGIVTSAPERTQAPCPHFGSCGGCQYQHATYPAQLRFKQTILRETLERAHINVPDEIAVLAGDPWSYRNRIRLAFDAQGNPGYRGRRSHQVVPISQCPIAAPVLVRAALEFAHLIREVAPSLRPTELALFCNADETALLLSIFTDRPAKSSLDSLAAALKLRIPALAGMEHVIEGGPSQPPRTIAQWGETSIAYRAAGFDYRVDHGAFFQINRWLLDAFVDAVVTPSASEGRSALACDLFAGVGLFARRLAGKFDRVIAVESARTATVALAQNLTGTSASAVSSSTLDFLRHNRKGDRPDLIVVDPPRTGLGPETTALLAEVAAPRLTYVSCDPATLARDLRALIPGGYIIEKVTLADLFPQTFHLETIVALRRA